MKSALVQHIKTCYRLLAAQAAYMSAPLLLRLALATTCHISTPGLAFGNYDVFNSVSTNGTGTINVSCDAPTNYTIALSAGQGTFAARTMMNGRNPRAYNLYSNLSYTTIWGDGSAGTVTVTGITATPTQTVYGRIPAQQNLPIGNYSDNIMMTLSFYSRRQTRQGLIALHIPAWRASGYPAI